MPIPRGYLTAEDIAAEMQVPIYRVQRVARELKIPQVVYEDNRRRYSPEDVKRIKEALAAKG